jgi:hypothetical protein
MAVGVVAGCGEVLPFLHADCVLPFGGNFRLLFDGGRRVTEFQVYLFAHPGNVWQSDVVTMPKQDILN